MYTAFFRTVCMYRDMWASLSYVNDAPNINQQTTICVHVLTATGYGLLVRTLLCGGYCYYYYYNYYYCFFFLFLPPDWKAEKWAVSLSAVKS